MTILEINDFNQRKMRESLQNVEHHFEWEDSEIINYLSGELPSIRDYYGKNNKIQTDLQELKKSYSSYNCYSTDKNTFITELKAIIKNINGKVKNWFGLNIETVEYYINLQHGCLLSGAGGIGKSYFIYKLEEELSRRNIKHLCIYGKYQKQLSDIDFDKIIAISKTEQFVFVIDAVNELPEEEKKVLLDKLKLLKENSKARIILTYRSYSLSEEYKKELKQFINEEYRFSGISFESALEIISKYPVSDLGVYTDILFSNNALLISKLIKILLDKEKRTDLDSITNVTYILEHDFMECLKQKSIQSKKDGKTYWRETKLLVEWMFENNRRDIPQYRLASILKETDETDYLYALGSIGYIIESRYNGEDFIYFSTDSLIDFLLSRFLFQKLDGLDDAKVIELLKNKISIFPTAIESFILVIFDKYKDDYKRVYRILKNSEILNDISFELLLKVIIKKENIGKFLDVFKPTNPACTILYFAGYVNKPFNCTYFLHQYLVTNKKAQLKELSTYLSNNYECQNFSRRLKNMLYYLIFSNPSEDVLYEYFYTGIWASSAPNENIRILARKLLFETVRINNNFINILIDLFPKILDYYIKDAIIETLSYHINSKLIKDFFYKLKLDFNFLSADGIARIAKYLGEKNQYITWNKYNLYKRSTRTISDKFEHLIFDIDSNDRYLLHFRYWDKNKIDNMFPSFLNANKTEIVKFNKFLETNFHCVKNGECCGASIFEKYIQKKYIKRYSNLPVISFLKSFERIVYLIFNEYAFLEDKLELQHSNSFSNSMKKKLIAQDIFYGSLMCNYFENEFISYNDKDDIIGYKVYNPITYESTENYTAPIPTYNNEIEQMQNCALKNIDESMNKDEKWVKNAELTKSNVLSLINTPIKFNKTEWILLAAQIFMKESTEKTSVWRDNYDISCCVSNDIKLKADEDDRYLTIEHRRYIGLLENYKLIYCLTKKKLRI